MKKIIATMLFMMFLSTTCAVLAEGGQNQGTTGTGATNTGSTAQGAGSQDRTGR